MWVTLPCLRAYSHPCSHLGCNTSTRAQLHKGVQLEFSSRQKAELLLNQSTAADVLCTLGAPQARWWREDERLGIHGVDALAGGMFFNYPSLGLDVLLSPPAPGREARVIKIVAHSNVPGSAGFARYERCPWTIETGSGSVGVVDSVSVA